MRTAIATDAAVKSRVRLLKILMMVWTLQTAVAAFAQPVTLITPTNTTWRYFNNGTDPGAEWALPGFDDSSWPQGVGLFGVDGTVYSPFGFNTPLPRPTGLITVYFRTHFPWNGSWRGIFLMGTNYVDDGCVVYLNGIEITRFNMPAGPPAFDTLAPAANPGGYPNLTGGEPVRVLMQISLDNLTNGNANPLLEGDNILAVEVHQNIFDSSDVVFGMSLFAGQCILPCFDGIQPTNRSVVASRSTTFVVNREFCSFAGSTFQWYRNVGLGEETIFGATNDVYTLTNATEILDEGVYYCRITYYTCGIGTVDTRQAVLTILPDPDPPSGQRIELIAVTNHVWRFLTNGTDQGTAWVAPQFDDSAWPQGRALFGNDSVYPNPFNTFIPGPGRGGPLTCYFRTHFTWNGPTHSVVLTGTNFVDDGNVVYLNGVEITRFAMPVGQPAFNTLATLGGATEPFIIPMTIPLDALTNSNANPLLIGDNVLAVEVHQTSATSADVVFGLSLYGQQARPPCLDGIQPTNRTVFEPRSTTFTVVEQCAVPPASIQWYRDVGLGEEIISGATNASFTLSNTVDNVDDGVYYARLTNRSGSVDSHQAVLVVQHDDVFPQFLSASVVVPGLNKFRLITDEPLCGDEIACGSDYANTFNWQILQSDNLSIDLEVETVVQINPTTYEFTTSSPRDPARHYQITVTPAWGMISDPFGSFVPPGTFAETPLTLTFQQGDANGYAGTQDAEIHSNAFADTPLGTAPQMKCDLDDAGTGIAQSLLRFDGITGFSPNQIPPGSRIRYATLTLNQVDPGSVINLHRLLISWDQTTATWNSLMNGVIADDVEARVVADATTPAMLANGTVGPDVTASVQSWADGQPNHGWALLSTGIDAWIVNTSESGASTAPLLTVEFEPIDECVPIIVGQPAPTLVVLEGHPFSISVGVLNPFGLVFQWTKDSVDIPGATGISYSIQNARLSDSGTYRLRISCESSPATSMISSPSLVIVRPDDSRAYLTGAAAKSDGTTVTLHFSKPLNEASVRNLANYTFTPALAVIDATLTNRTSSAIVTLTTAPREVANYVLRIANLFDTSSGGNWIFPNPTFVTLTSARVILPWDADGWHYNTNNLDATPDWKNPNFVPGPDWRTGRGFFGTEVPIGPLIPWLNFIATPLIPNNVLAESELRVTAYFRKAIDLPALPPGTRYVICHYADDGFIAYLDGAEIHRFAMPASAVTFTNRSTGIPTGDATLRSFTFNATPGIHTLAVELHQAGVTSSDVLFGMEVGLVAGTSPSLSIAQSVNGDVNLNWNADDHWRLRSAATPSGPYLDVVIPIGNRLGTYTLPSAAVTNRSFWLLDYTGHP